MKKTTQKNISAPFYMYGKNAVLEILHNKVNDVSEVVLVDFAKEHKTDKSAFAPILTAAKNAKIKVRYISKKEAEVLVGEVRTQRVLARVKGFKYLPFKDWKESIKKQQKENGDTVAPQLVLVLDKVEDPQNFGAIVRSAGAVGVSAVFVANASQSPVNATVFKTSAGVITKVPIVQVANISDTLEKLKDLGFWNYGVSMDELSEQEKEDNPYAEGSKSMWGQEFDAQAALVVGAEGKGLSRIAKEHCDFLIHIPMENNVDSLNVSVAAALTMYEWRRQQD